MRTLKALKQDLHDAKAEGRSILDAADKAGRALTADEETAFAAIEAKVGKISGEIEAAERMSDRRRAMDAGGSAIDVNGRIEVGADRASLDPRAGFASLAEFANAVRRANPAVANSTVDPRISAMYSGTASGFMREGGSNDGYMVPPEFRDRIWELVFAGDNLLAEIDSEPTNSNQVNDLQDEWTPWGGTGIQARWRSEGGTMTLQRPSDLTPRSVILHELFAFVAASDELLEDAPRLANRLDNKAAQAINWKIDDSIQFGNGVGKPLGWMSSGALVSVAKETGQAAATLDVQNLAKMYSRMLGDSVSRAYWRMNSDVIPQLIGLKLGDHAIWTPPASGITGAPGGFLFGRPIKLTEHCKTLGEKGDIMFVDPKGYYGLTKANGGVKFASSIHLYFDQGLQAFRWTIRLGGQPHLRVPISPKNGSNTKSHFVTLDARA